MDLNKGVASPRAAVVRRIALTATLMLSAPSAHANSIAPEVVELSPSRPVASITFTNPGDQAIRFQTRVRAWRQLNGADSYDESADLVVSPAVAEIAAGETHGFRVARRGPAPKREQAYRIAFEAVPTAADPDPRQTALRKRILAAYRLAAIDATTSAEPDSDDVADALHDGQELPVFVSVAAQPQAQLHIRPCQGRAPGAACVRLENTGNHYAQVSALDVERGNWRARMVIDASILAGAWREWDLEVPAGSIGPIRVSTAVADGMASQELSASIK